MIDEPNNLNLGVYLKQMREDAKLSIDDIAYQTRIPAKYISWLESGNYKNLPAEVYVKGFIAKYAKVLNLEKDDLLKIYFQESAAFNRARSKKNAVPTLKSPRFVITPRFIAAMIGLMIFAGVFGYLGWQVYFLTRQPRITLETMQSDFVTGEENHFLKGNVIGANILTINNKSINFNEKGEFDEVLNLSEGLNVIELKAENRFGKNTTLLRKIILNNQ